MKSTDGNLVYNEFNVPFDNATFEAHLIYILSSSTTTLVGRSDQRTASHAKKNCKHQSEVFFMGPLHELWSAGPDMQRLRPPPQHWRLLQDQ
jgi:hypothetical protein